MLYLDVIEVGHVLDKTLTIVVVDGFRPQRVDVHGTTGNEVLDAPLDLRRATCIVRAVPGRLSLIADEWRAAFGTALDELYGLGDDRPLVDVHPNYFRNDLASLFHIDIIADMQVETLDEVLVVERGPLHGRTRQLHGIHIGHGRDGTSTPHLIGHLVQSGADALGLELIGDGPAGTLGRETE